MNESNKTSDEMFEELNYKIEKKGISHTYTKDDLEIMFLLRTNTVFLKKINQYKQIMLSADEIKAINKKLEEQSKNEIFSKSQNI